MPAFQSDTATAWSWSTSRLVSVIVEVDGHREFAVLDMPKARTLLNELTEAIAEVDARDMGSEEALAALRVKLGC